MISITKIRSFCTVLIFLSIVSNSLFSQNVGINSSGGSPNGSAMLDVESTDKGLLIPRVALTSNTDVATISSPATGLMIYNTATTGSGTNSVVPGFYYYTGSIWQKILGSSPLIDNDQDTKVDVEESADEDLIRIDMAGTEYFVLNGPRINVVNSGSSTFLGNDAGSSDDLTNNENVFIGTDAGKNATTAFQNVALGVGALENITIGNIGRSVYFGNTAIGHNALNSQITGGAAAGPNTTIGAFSLSSITTGGRNAAIGFEALKNGTTASHNVIIGHQAAESLITGSRNVALGFQAMTGNTSGSNNIIIGHLAGSNDTGSDKLFIDYSITATSDSTNALIYGEFDNEVLRFNGNVGIGLQPQGKLHVDGSLIQDMDTIAADQTTPSVDGANIFITSANSGATAITDLTNPQAGQIITIIGGSNTNPSTIADGGNFNLSASWTANQDDVIVLFVVADNNYIELSRVNN